jgi:hypothetical protein
MPAILTVVLVTQPSRESFFELSVQSVCRALQMFETVRLLIVLNGASEVSNLIARNVQRYFPQRVTIRRIEENSALPNDLWRILSEECVSWAHFPGDDDIVISASYKHFFEILDRYPATIAVPFRAAVINEEGRPTGKKLTPYHFTGVQDDNLLASAFHKPPFIWPSLIFNIQSIEDDLYLSRYVFDWWIGLNLVCRGEVRSVNHTLVQYRIHKEQESQKASEFRKRFEARLMIDAFVHSEAFSTRARSITSTSKFVSSLERNPPIYGDITLGTPVLLSILNKVHRLLNVRLQLKESYLSKYFIKNRVPMTLSETPHYSWCELPSSKKVNFQLYVDRGTCKEFREAVQKFFDKEGEIIGTLGCQHTDTRSESIVLMDCQDMLDKTDTQLLRELIFSAESVLQNSSVSLHSLAPWEVFLLRKVRAIFRALRLFRLLIRY